MRIHNNFISINFRVEPKPQWWIEWERNTMFHIKIHYMCYTLFSSFIKKSTHTHTIARKLCAKWIVACVPFYIYPCFLFGSSPFIQTAVGLFARGWMFSLALDWRWYSKHVICKAVETQKEENKTRAKKKLTSYTIRYVHDF